MCNKNATMTPLSCSDMESSLSLGSPQEFILSFFYGLFELAIEDIIDQDVVCGRLLDKLVEDNDALLHQMVEIYGSTNEERNTIQGKNNILPDNIGCNKEHKASEKPMCTETEMVEKVEHEQNKGVLPHSMRRLIQLVCLRSNLRSEVERSKRRTSSPSSAVAPCHFLYPQDDIEEVTPPIQSINEREKGLHSLAHALSAPLREVAAQLFVDPGSPSAFRQWSFHTLTRLFSPVDSQHADGSQEGDEVSQIPEKLLYVLGKIIIGYAVCAWNPCEKHKVQYSRNGTECIRTPQAGYLSVYESVRRKTLASIARALSSSFPHSSTSHKPNKAYTLFNECQEKELLGSDAVSVLSTPLSRRRSWSSECSVGSQKDQLIGSSKFFSSGEDNSFLFISSSEKKRKEPDSFIMSDIEKCPQTSLTVEKERWDSLNEGRDAVQHFSSSFQGIYSEEKLRLLQNSELLSASPVLLAGYHSQLDSFTGSCLHRKRKRERSASPPIEWIAGGSQGDEIQ